MSVPLPGENIPIWGSYLRALRARPILVKALTSSVAMTTAEYISQKMAGIEDQKRINTFTMWGMFLGIPNHFWQQIIATYGPDPLKSIWNYLLPRVCLYITTAARGTSPGYRAPCGA